MIADLLGYALSLGAFGFAVAIVTAAQPPRNRRVRRLPLPLPEAPRNTRVHVGCPRRGDCAGCAEGVARCRRCGRTQCAIALRGELCPRCGRG